MKKNILEIFIGLLLLFFYTVMVVVLLILLVYIAEHEFVLKIFLCILISIFLFPTAKLLGKDFLRKLNKKYKLWGEKTDEKFN